MVRRASDACIGDHGMPGERRPLFLVRRGPGEDVRTRTGLVFHDHGVLLFTGDRLVRCVRGICPVRAEFFREWNSSNEMVASSAMLFIPDTFCIFSRSWNVFMECFIKFVSHVVTICDL